MDSTAVASKNKPEFEGSADQQSLAAKAFDLYRRQGMLFAADAPITIALDRLVAGLSKSYPGVSADDLGARITDALQASPDVFKQDEAEGKPAFVSTKTGRFSNRAEDARHMFSNRLNASASEVSAQDSRTMTENWLLSAQSRNESFSVFQEPAAEAALGMGARADIGSTVAPSSPYTLPQRQTPRTPVDRHESPLIGARATTPPMDVHPIMSSPEPADAEIDESPMVTPVEIPYQAVVIEPEPTVATPVDEELYVQAAPEALVVADTVPAPVEPVAPTIPTPVPATPAPAPTPVAAAPTTPAPTPAPATPAPAPVAPARRAAPYTINTPNGPESLDLSRPLDEVIAEYGAVLTGMMSAALRDDFRFTSFGDEWYPEEGVERFSKGDFRRIREYLVETQEALSDRAFMSDVLNRRESDPDYERLRFSLNYRLLREKKDFEFVGIGDAHLWVVANQSPVTVPKRKPAEIGTDYRFLEDASIQSLEPALPEDTQRLDYSLSYYEYENGLLPYDKRAKSILPGPTLEDQRAALLRIEVPVLFTSFPVELRYPTGNRGGYIVGFDGFFQENLVPGSSFSLEPTDQANVLVLRFERTGAQEANMLQIDERRNRYVFRPVSYYTETNSVWMLTEDRYPKLDNTKRLDESERKKADGVIGQAFETAGDDDSGRLYALLDDVMPVANIERPFSIGAIRAVIENSNAFEADPSTPGAFWYDPSKR